MKISVLGGGISGLVAAYNLSLNPSAHVSLYEASDRFGGWIETRRTENDALFELGPHSMRCVGDNGMRTLALIDEIALNEEVVSVTKEHPAAKRRYLGLNGELFPLPYSFKSLLTHPYRRQFISGVFRDLFTKRRATVTDESVYMFFKRRFGRELADLVSDPMCRGISAADSRTLGISGMFPQLVRMEQLSGGVIRGMYHSETQNPEMLENAFARKAKYEGWRMLNFKHGMEQFPRALLNMLRDAHNVDVYENSPVQEISVRNPGVSVTVEGGRPRHCDHVVSALPAHVLATCLKTEESTLSSHLAQIMFTDVALVSLEYRDIDFDLEAFGCLLPSYENPAVLGIIFDSAIFPESNSPHYPSHRLSLMVGGEWFAEHFGDTEHCDKSLIEKMALGAVHQYLGISATPSQCHVDILEKCIPHYTVGHRNKVKHMLRIITEEKLRLSLIGASFFGAGIPDCICNAIDHTEPLHAIMNDRYFPNAGLEGEEEEEDVLRG